MEDNNEKTEIRTDLWHEMDINRLQNQRELILGKLSLLTQSAQSTTVVQIYKALQAALDAINNLIDNNLTNNTPRSSHTSTL